MKHARKWLACLLAGALALAVLTGCSALMGGTVQKDTEQAKALMKEVDLRPPSRAPSASSLTRP